MSSTPGFSNELWSQFAQDGILIIEDALPQVEIDSLREVMQSIWTHANSPEGLCRTNIVEMHPIFAKMIDHPSHIGFIYDVYGEMIKLLLSQFFIRPPGQAIRNRWHFDGPRPLPFSRFSPQLPLRIKVGYWLTDLLKPEMGNLIYIPGSHRWETLPQYHTHETHPQERQLKVKAGSLILMYSGLWHRVAENNSNQTRLNLFYEYGPSWIQASDRYQSNREFLESLTERQKMILRSYDFPNAHIKTPASSFGLFDEVLPNHPENVPIEIRRHLTKLEQNQQSQS